MKPLKFITLIALLSLCYSMLLLSACSGGNGSSDTSATVIDLPFEYTIGASFLEISNEIGTVYAAPGAFGAHFNPFSGDPVGDTKSNFMTFFAASERDFTAFFGNGDGQCSDGELCGLEITADEIRQRTPVYKAATDAVLRRVTLHGGPDNSYFDSPQHWEIAYTIGPNYRQRIGHLAKISPDLRDRIFDATGIDTDTYSTLGDLFRDNNIPIKAGDELAMPQVFAREVSGFPGYFASNGGGVGVPWAQMEFPFIDHSESAEVCMFNLMDSSKSAAIQAAMDNDMADPDSPHYAPYANRKWLWGAEGVLCPAHTSKPDNFSSIHTRLGGWTERPTASTTVDEWFTIVPIIKTATVYDSSNYDSVTVNHVVARVPGPGFPGLKFTMPDMTEVEVFQLAGEVLEETSGTLLVKWRDIWTGNVYQRATFLLDNDGLKIKWSDFVASRDEAIQPALSSGEACNDNNVLCYDHQHRL